jgi:hypothetical protein
MRAAWAAAVLLLLGGAEALQLGESPKTQPTKGAVSIAAAAPVKGAATFAGEPPKAVESAIPQPEAKGAEGSVPPAKR